MSNYISALSKTYKQCLKTKTINFQTAIERVAKIPENDQKIIATESNNPEVLIVLGALTDHVKVAGIIIDKMIDRQDEFSKIFYDLFTTYFPSCSTIFKHRLFQLMKINKGLF